MHMNPSPIRSVDECQPACTSCGSVECFERPRFFCGQLLTDRDLNLEQRYVVEKNKLHNRYLYGAGVVCGLGVYCGQCCDCCVVVHPGYAIDCCGNDVVVCEPTTFDVCAYINKCFCRPDPCLDTRLNPQDCDDKLPRQYLLLVSYDETPGDPVTAFGQERCGCGGHGAAKSSGKTGGCGCSGKCGDGGQKAEPASSSAGRCEPSRIRESFRLSLIPAARKPARLPKSYLKNLATHAAFENDWAALPKPKITPTLKPDEFFAAQSALLAQRDFLLRTIDKTPTIRCGLRRDVIKVPLPEQLTPGWDAIAIFASIQYIAVQSQIEKGLLSDVLVGACDACDEEADEGVVLASVLVQNGKVLAINNLERSVVLTPRTMRDVLRTIAEPVWDKLTAYTIAGGPMATTADTFAMRATADPTGAAADPLTRRVTVALKQVSDWAVALLNTWLPEAKALDVTRTTRSRRGGGNP